jgi:hypothetical protein
VTFGEATDPNATPPSDDEHAPDPRIEERGKGFGFRALGCLVSFVAFSLLLALPDMLGLRVPAIPLALVSLAAGVGCLTIYVRAVRSRWGVESPDVVQLLEHDLKSLGMKHLDDFRLRHATDWPMRERLLHEALYTVKWLGHLLVFAGAGWLIYQLMLLAGIVHK